MNNGFLLFLGIALAMATSWFGLIFGSQMQLNRLDYSETLDRKVYPATRPGLPQEGLQVYRANGCYYCHTQQVRPEGLGGDIERGWSLRRTVARDFLHDQPAMIGFSRIGPDLANVGERLSDRQWQLIHLYDPKTTVERSVMPPYRYLFETRPVRMEPSRDALRLPDGFGPEPGYEVVPTAEGRALVAYLLSLRASEPILEAPREFEEVEEQPEETDEETADEPIEETDGAQTPD